MKTIATKQNQPIKTQVWKIGAAIPVPHALAKLVVFRSRHSTLRSPGIEPGSSAWEAPMITITLQAHNTPGGDRTHDPRLIRPVLYR